MTDTVSQVAYYREHAHASGVEDLSDTREYWERRTSLYKDLGFPPLFFRGARILEVGCGSGYTSAHLAQFHPRAMVLAEPVEICHTAIRENFRVLAPNTPFEILSAFGQELNLDEPCDFAVAEGFLSSLLDATSAARAIGRWVVPGGGFCLTTQDHAGYLSDLVKRFCGRWLIRQAETFDAMERILFPFYRDLLQIPGMSRSCDDWVRDNVLQPLYNWDLFSTEDAIRSLETDFVFYSCSSPRYSTESRWFKRQCGAGNDFNALAVGQYRRNIHNMLDSRHAAPERDEGENLALLESCRRVVLAMGRFEAESSDAAALQVRERLGEVRGTCARMDLHPETLLGLEDALRLIDSLFSSATPRPSPGLAKWSGRGQHYVSFLKRDGTFLR